MIPTIPVLIFRNLLIFLIVFKFLFDNENKLLDNLPFLNTISPYFFYVWNLIIDEQTSVLSSIESVLHFRIVDVVISGYCTLFGILICIVEGQNFIPNYDILLPIRVSVLRFLPFLKYLWGRGALYTFSGALQLSQLRPMNIFSGLFLVGVGILFGKFCCCFGPNPTPPYSIS